MTVTHAILIVLVLQLIATLIDIRTHYRDHKR